MGVLSEEMRTKAEQLVAGYPAPRSALMPLLYLVQAEEGHVTREGMQEVAEILGLTTAEVEAVATFYTMLRKRPTGKWLISVCTNVSCALLGGRELYEKAREFADARALHGRANQLARLLRALNHLRDLGNKSVERFMHRNSARLAFRKRRSPARLVGGKIEGAQVPRMMLEGRS
mgnify:CR=1 FL=1